MIQHVNSHLHCCLTTPAFVHTAAIARLHRARREAVYQLAAVGQLKGVNCLNCLRPRQGRRRSRAEYREATGSVQLAAGAVASKHGLWPTPCCRRAAPGARRAGRGARRHALVDPRLELRAGGHRHVGDALGGASPHHPGLVRVPHDGPPRQVVRAFRLPTPPDAAAAA